MEMIVVNTVARGDSQRVRSYAVIHVIDVGVLQREIVSITGDGPSGIVTDNVVHGHVIGIMPEDAVVARSGRIVGCRRAHIKVLDSQVLYRARGASSGMYAYRILAVSAARSIGSVLDNAIGAPIHDNVAAVVYVNRAQSRPVWRSENRVRHEFDGDGFSRGSASTYH